ncbi:MAG: hypothetical protein ACREI3_07005 [Nitrospirales bacterium]
MMQTQIRVSGQTALHPCGCGRFHFTYGPLTLHFEPREFFLFAADVGRLARLVTGAQEGQAKAVLQAAKGSCH